MIRNIHPADELALIRDDMRKLKAREAFLQRGFLGDRLSRFGDEVVVEVAVIRNRKFLRDRLPKTILNDAAYWEDLRSQHVQVRPR